MGLEGLLGSLANRRALHVLRRRQHPAHVLGSLPRVGVDDRLLSGLQLPGEGGEGRETAGRTSIE